MKKLLITISLLFGLLACTNIGYANEYNGVTAIIDGKTAGKVHLREGPSKDSKSLGLYFTGTVVLCEPSYNSEWVWSIIGKEFGYINTNYLYFGNDPSSITPQQPRGIVNNKYGSNWANLRYDPSLDSPVAQKLYNGEEVTILGETVAHWYYVKAGDQYGYMQSSYVQMGDPVGNAGNVPGGNLTGSITTVKADPKDCVEVYITVKNCTLNIVPTDGKMVECTYDTRLLSFEQTMARGTHMITLESINNTYVGDNAAATLHIPRYVFHTLFVDVEGGTASIASGIGSLYDITATDSHVSMHYPAGNVYNYIIRLTNSTCSIGISENATNYSISVNRISGNSSVVPTDGMPLFQKNQQSYFYTNGSDNTKISVDVLENSVLRLLPIR